MTTIEKLQKFGQLQVALQIDIFKEHIFRQTFQQIDLDTFKQIDSNRYLERNMCI
jgi:hypothetical protein